MNDDDHEESVTLAYESYRWKICDDRELISASEPLLPESLFMELFKLQKETGLSVRAMVRVAVRRYVDSEKSNEGHVWVDGVKYPVPKRAR